MAIAERINEVNGTKGLASDEWVRPSAAPEPFLPEEDFLETPRVVLKKAEASWAKANDLLCQLEAEDKAFVSENFLVDSAQGRSEWMQISVGQEPKENLTKKGNIVLNPEFMGEALETMLELGKDVTFCIRVADHPLVEDSEGNLERYKPEPTTLGLTVFASTIEELNEINSLFKEKFLEKTNPKDEFGHCDVITLAVPPAPQRSIKLPNFSLRPNFGMLGGAMAVAALGLVAASVVQGGNTETSIAAPSTPRDLTLTSQPVETARTLENASDSSSQDEEEFLGEVEPEEELEEVEPVKKLLVPNLNIHFNQFDPQWKKADSCYDAGSGCGPNVISMLDRMYGGDLTPAQAAREMAEPDRNGRVMKPCGYTDSQMTGLSGAVQKLLVEKRGFSVIKELPGSTSVKVLREYLKEDVIIIASGKPTWAFRERNPQDTHILLITGVDEKVPENIIVNDSTLTRPQQSQLFSNGNWNVESGYFIVIGKYQK